MPSPETGIEEGEQFHAAVRELIETEKTYVERLVTIYDIYKLQAEEALTREERSLLFGNLEEILAVNGAFYQDLVEASTDPTRLAAVIDTGLNGLQCYASYCCNHRRATSFIRDREARDPSFKRFLTGCLESSSSHGLDLASFLLEPVQRIARYPLLVKQIAEYCTGDKALKERFRAVQQKISAILESVNAKVGAHENEERLRELSVLLEWTEYKVNLGEATAWGAARQLLVPDIPCLEMKSGDPVFGYLFSDLFVIARTLSNSRQQVVGAPWPIEQLDFDGQAIVYGQERATLRDSDDEMLTVRIRECIDGAQQAFYRSLDGQLVDSGAMEYAGSLIVQVHSAHSLYVLPTSYTRDPLPFCRLKLETAGTVHSQSDTPCALGTEPVWREESNVVELLCSGPGDVLLFEVLDKRPFAPPIPLGRARVPIGDLADYFAGQPVRQVLELEGVPRGQLTVTVTYNTL